MHTRLSIYAGLAAALVWSGGNDAIGQTRGTTGQNGQGGTGSTSMFSGGGSSSRSATSTTRSSVT